MLVLYNLRLGFITHSLTNGLAEGLLSASTILLTQGEVHKALGGKRTRQAYALSLWSPE